MSPAAFEPLLLMGEVPNSACPAAGFRHPGESRCSLKPTPWLSP